MPRLPIRSLIMELHDYVHTCGHIRWCVHDIVAVDVYDTVAGALPEERDRNNDTALRSIWRWR